MLDVTTLFGALEAFCDPELPLAAFPRDENDAKARWAAAFYSYVRDISPALPSAGVAAAFAAALDFSPGLGAMPSATDLAAAWSAAMTTMGTFDALPARESTLRAALGAELSSPTIVAASRIHAIAGAFDSVTRGITSGGGSIVYS